MGNLECHHLRSALEAAFDHDVHDLHQRLDLIQCLYVERLTSSPFSTRQHSGTLSKLDSTTLSSATSSSSIGPSLRTPSTAPRRSRDRCNYCNRIGHSLEDCHTRTTASGLCFVCVVLRPPQLYLRSPVGPSRQTG